MDISELRDIIKRAASLFGTAGAKAQQKALDDVDSLIADSGATTVEDFVDSTVAALERPAFSELDDEAVIAQLYSVGAKANESERLLSELKALSKDKLASVASRFTSLPAKSVATKPKALKAIQAKLKEQAYQEAKRSENAGVTPW